MQSVEVRTIQAGHSSIGSLRTGKKSDILSRWIQVTVQVFRAVDDCMVIRKTNLKLADLYRPTGIYRYVSGWNWRAVAALLIGMFVALGGAYSSLDAAGKATGPFPPEGIVGFLHFQLPWGGYLYDYSWVLGLIVSFVLYYVFMRFMPQREQQLEAAAQPV